MERCSRLSGLNQINSLLNLWEVSNVPYTCISDTLATFTILGINSGGSRISRMGGCGLPRRIRFENFVCQKERIWTLGGGVRRARPLDPPMIKAESGDSEEEPMRFDAVIPVKRPRKELEELDKTALERKTEATLHKKVVDKIDAAEVEKVSEQSVKKDAPSDVKVAFSIFTSRVCGRDNDFVVCVCVCVCVSLSVCLSVQAINFEWVDIETSFVVWCYILTISRSSLSIKVIGSRSRPSHGKC